MAGKDKLKQRPFAVFDIDGTLIRWQLYHSIFNELAREGKLGDNAEQEIHDARMIWKRRTSPNSFHDYEMAIVKIQQRMLKTIKPPDYQNAIHTVFETYKDQVYTFTRDLINKLKAQNYYLFALSGSPQEVLDKIVSYYNFDSGIGTKFTQQGGHFVGIASSPLHKKDSYLKDLVKEFGATWQGSIGIGDSLGDSSFLELVEKPIAFNPDREFLKHAKTKKWPIVVERKNMIYELKEKDGQYLLA